MGMSARDGKCSTHNKVTLTGQTFGLDLDYILHRWVKQRNLSFQNKDSQS